MNKPKMVFVFMVKPGLLLPRLQTYIFSRVPGFSRMASFTLHTEDGKGLASQSHPYSAHHLCWKPRSTHFFTPWSGQSSITFGSL